MTAKSVARWRSIHRWTSLICSLFMLMLCLTGLPLIFIDEIDRNFAGHKAIPDVPAPSAPANIDDVARAAHGKMPGYQILYIDWDLNDPLYGVNMASVDHPNDRRQLVFDSRTGNYLEDAAVKGQPVRLFLFAMNRLHIEMFAGLSGELFLGAMGLCFTAALVSGVVIYAPYMRKLDFGTIRGESGQRRRSLDTHNLFGIALLGWLAVIGVTGALNSVGQPGYDFWRRSTVPALVAPFLDAPAPAQLVGFQAAVDAARDALPSGRMVRVTPPGGKQGSPRHYVVWTQGDQPITKRLFRPVLVDAETGAVILAEPPPWYLTASQIARPLHFGDYGGLPLKILWAIFDIGGIIVLITGLKLWWLRGREYRPD